MTFKVIWTDSALADVRDIYEYVYNLAGAAAADKLAADLMASTRFLPEFPRLYPAFPSAVDERTRHIIVRSTWRVLYWVDDDSRCCDILTVVYGRRKIDPK